MAKEAWSIAMFEVVATTENIRDWQPVVCAPVTAILQQRFFQCKRYGGASGQGHKEAAIHTGSLDGGFSKIQAIPARTSLRMPKRYRVGRAVVQQGNHRHGYRTCFDHADIGFGQPLAF